MKWGVFTFAAMTLAAVACRGWVRLCTIATIGAMLDVGGASSVAIEGMEQNHRS